jgi:hypothetical protein
MKIDIFIHTNSGSIRFTAQSSHPFLAGDIWTNTDLDILSKQVAEDIDAKINLYLEADWKPAYLVAVKDHKVGIRNQRSFGIVIERTALRVNRLSTRGNRGERDVMGNGQRGTVIERHRDDNHDVDGDLVTRMRYRSDEGQSILIVEKNPQDEQALSDLESVFDRITHRLQDWISPNAVEGNKIPHLDEIQDLMLEAIADVRAQKEQDT